MKCPRSNNCLSYPEKCTACQVTSSAFDNYPYLVEIAPRRSEDLIKFKIFFGSYPRQTADYELNLWLANNPWVYIIDYQYQQHQHGHSICIRYTEKTDE